MPADDDYLARTDAELLAQCDVHLFRSSGPGGQHRNKVSSAVRLRHQPTGITAHSDASRSQHENRRLALRRLRMAIACRVRRPLDPAAELPAVVEACLFHPRSRQGGACRRIEIGPRDSRFWQVGAFLLDLLDACGGRLTAAAAAMQVTTSNLVRLLKSHRRLLAAAQEIRRTHGLGGLK